MNPNTKYSKKDYKGGKLSIRRAERDLIVKSLNRSINQIIAAHQLGISTRNLNFKMNRHLINKDNQKQYYSHNKDF